MGTNTDPLQALAHTFLGVNYAPIAFPDPMDATVVSSTDTTVTVTIKGFDPTGKSTFTAKYQKVPGASPATPPKGTDCQIVFSGKIAANGTTSAYVGGAWVSAFSGWPT